MSATVGFALAGMSSTIMWMGVCNINAMNLYIKWNRTHGNQDVIYTLLMLTTGSARFGAFGGFGAFGAFGGFFRFIAGFGASFTTIDIG